MPFMAPSGCYWRCWIGPVKFFYRNHGAILHEEAGASPDDEVQARATIARYSSWQGNQYFGGRTRKWIMSVVLLTSSSSVSVLSPTAAFLKLFVRGISPKRAS